MLSEVPGIIEARMIIRPNPDGKVSFSVLIATGCDRGAGSGLIELIISPEHIQRALAHAKIHALAATGSEEVQTFPCLVGFSSVTPGSW